MIIFISFLKISHWSVISFQESLEVVEKALCFLALTLCVITGGVPSITSGPHGNLERKTQPATKHLPAMDNGTVSLSDRQLFPYVWNTKMFPYAQSPCHWGEKGAGWITQTFSRGCGMTPLQSTCSLHHGQRVTVGVEGDLTPNHWCQKFLSCSASWRWGSISSEIAMAKVTILSSSWWPAPLNIALMWPFLSSRGKSEG